MKHADDILALLNALENALRSPVPEIDERRLSGKNLSEQAGNAKSDIDNIALLPLLKRADALGLIVFEEPLMSIFDEGTERRDLYAYAALVAAGIKPVVVRRLSGQKNIDLVIGGEYFEIKSITGNTVGRSMMKAMGQFRDHPAANSDAVRVILNGRYAVLDDDGVKEGLLKYKSKYSEIAEILQVSKKGRVDRL